MKLGLEIDMVVKDSLVAFSVYEKVFGAVKIEATAYGQGLNEVIFSINGSRIHLLDENIEYNLFAPRSDSKYCSAWLNVYVENINLTFKNAEQEMFDVIQPLTAIDELGIINAVVKDPFGHVWMLHQIVAEVSFEDRCKIMDEINQN